MDVCCTRCGTEYEFDDALISERGTSVRCTQCGYQFRVYPPKLAKVGPDEWVVLTGLGRRIVYRSLRELQNGIVKCEVAREDLLARGSKPPRPLGSIAELDPLFVVKSAPERQPSTLTGVAPPAAASTAPASTAAASTAAAAASSPRTDAKGGVTTGRREAKDTFSGVAPPANPPLDADVGPAERTLPARVPDGQTPRAGRSGTVLGLGVPFDASLRPAPATFPRPDDKGTMSAVPRTVAFEPRRDGEPKKVEGTAEMALSLPRTSDVQAPKPSTESASEPQTPEPEASIAVTFAAAVAPEINAEPAKPTPNPDEEVTVELPRKPEVAEPARQESVREERQIGTSTPENAAKAEAALARVQLQHKLVHTDAGIPAVAASEPPTERWKGPPAGLRSDGSARPGPVSEPDVNSTRFVEPRISMFAKPQKDAAATDPSVIVATEPSEETPAKATVDDLTAPSARARARAAKAAKASAKLPSDEQPSRGNSERVQKAPFPIGRIVVSVGLLALGMFAGMKIVGALLQGQKRPQPVPAVSALPPQSAWEKAIDEALARGDEHGAQRQLDGVLAQERASTKYRVMSARVSALQCDISWWKVQLSGKISTDAHAQSKQKLAECLDRLKLALGEAGPESDWPDAVLAASLDASRMQGDNGDGRDASMVERLKRATAIELKYSQAIRAWTKAGAPDDATIAILRQVRSKPVDLGPRAVALVVGLTQLHRVDEARSELKTLEAQSPPHPLASEMAGYVAAAEHTGGEAGAGAGATATPDAGIPRDNGAVDGEDAELYKGDFRLRLTRASECLARNELTRAQKLLRSVLEQRPNDTEAITGLADIHRRRGDSTHARKMYDKALALNSNYLPALSGAAEVRWMSGDRAGAVAVYRRMLDSVGDTPGYGQVAAARVKEFEKTAKAAGDAPESDGKKPAGADETKTGSERNLKDLP